MLKQKEFDLILEEFRNKNLEGYDEWFNENVNCEVKDETKASGWCRGIRLQSTSKKHAVVVVEDLHVMVTVSFDNLKMIEGK